MSRPLPLRVLSALLAVWFTVYTVEPAALHACDLHGVPAEAATAAGHEMHAGHHPISTSDAGEPAETSCCTCPGACAVTSAAALSTTATALSVVTTATTDTGLPDYEYVPVAAAHLLPFANGPPTRA